jgi:hypothetical protein
MCSSFPNEEGVWETFEDSEASLSVGWGCMGCGGKMRDAGTWYCVSGMGRGFVVREVDSGSCKECTNLRGPGEKRVRSFVKGSWESCEWEGDVWVDGDEGGEMVEVQTGVGLVMRIPVRQGMTVLPADVDYAEGDVTVVMEVFG